MSEPEARSQAGRAGRLLVASGIAPPEAGGPATWMQDVLPALQALGWEAEVISYGDAANGGQAWPLQRIPRGVLPLRLARYARAAWPRMRRADLVLHTTPGLPLPPGGPPRVYRIVGDQAWERSIRRGWIPPDEDIERFQCQRYGRLVELQKTLRSRELQRARRVIVPGDWLRRLVTGWGVMPTQIQIIPNALPPLAAMPAPDQYGARRQLGLDDYPLLLTAARLTPWKGIDRLLSALAQVPHFRLIIAGDGPQRPALERQVEQLRLEPRVRFMGRIARPQLALYMQAADWFVLYSGYEGLSHSLLESLRVGTPVIASDRCGNPEVVTDDHNGLLVPWPDGEALEAALRRALQQDLRERLAGNAADGLERFSFERMVSQTDALLRICRD
ncbi:MAG: glycosyltransferase family 4 protein [Anaerolineaceae bacterium]|nr:glycosyltransferase family 4 protein [Anaerolineaceae bacterium]